MVLAALGADVIKVERIDGGDDARHMGPHLGHWGAFFVPLNRGKRSITVDITQPAGRDLILRLARSSDVFIENFRAGKMKALGLDESAVRAQNPNIIYSSLSAYGSRGPDYLKSGYDALVQARSGIVSVTGVDANSPIRAGVSLIDMGTGMWTAIGILAALFERRKSGIAQRIDSSLFQTGVMMMCYHLVYRQFSGGNPVPQGSRHTAFAPYCAFDTADGRIMLGVSNERMFRRLCAAIERPDWVQDPRFATNVLRVQNRDDLEARLQQVFREKTTAQWTVLFDARDVPFSPIQNAEEVLNDPQLAAIGQMETTVLPGTDDRDISVPRLPFELSLTPQEFLSPPPALGEHGRAILAEAGYSDAEIRQLAESGACNLP